jgi:hypothetical protein
MFKFLVNFSMRKKSVTVVTDDLDEGEHACGATLRCGCGAPMTMLSSAPRYLPQLGSRAHTLIDVAPHIVAIPLLPEKRMWGE